MHRTGEQKTFLQKSKQAKKKKEELVLNTDIYRGVNRSVGRYADVTATATVSLLRETKVRVLLY